MLISFHQHFLLDYMALSKDQIMIYKEGGLLLNIRTALNLFFVTIHLP